MTFNSAAKGAQAEREAATIISDLLGFIVKRKLGAGRKEDTGDIHGLPNTVIQVAWWKETLRAVREKPLGAEAQRINDGALFAASFIRFMGGGFRVVLTPEQFAVLWREAQPVSCPTCAARRGDV